MLSNILRKSYHINTHSQKIKMSSVPPTNVVVFPLQLSTFTPPEDGIPSLLFKAYGQHFYTSLPINRLKKIINEVFDGVAGVTKRVHNKNQFELVIGRSPDEMSMEEMLSPTSPAIVEMQKPCDSDYHNDWRIVCALEDAAERLSYQQTLVESWFETNYCRIKVSIYRDKENNNYLVEYIRLKGQFRVGDPIWKRLSAEVIRHESCWRNRKAYLELEVGCKNHEEKGHIAKFLFDEMMMREVCQFLG